MIIAIVCAVFTIALCVVGEFMMHERRKAYDRFEAKLDAWKPICRSDADICEAMRKDWNNDEKFFAWLNAN